MAFVESYKHVDESGNRVFLFGHTHKPVYRLQASIPFCRIMWTVIEIHGQKIQIQL